MPDSPRLPRVCDIEHIGSKAPSPYIATDLHGMDKVGSIPLLNKPQFLLILGTPRVPFFFTIV